MNFEIKSIAKPDDAQLESVYVHLRMHNQTAATTAWEARENPENAPKPINLFAYDSDGEIVAGLFGTTQFAWLKVAIMATEPAHRSKGIGRELLTRAEEIAFERGCTKAFVDTMEFQSPDFYRAAGYAIACKIPDWDSHGHAKFFFTKDLC